jgi:hypothetical protein
MRDDNCLTTHRSPIPPTLNKAAERSRPVSPHKKLRPNTPQVLFPPRTVKMHFEDLHAMAVHHEVERASPPLQQFTAPPAMAVDAAVQDRRAHLYGLLHAKTPELIRPIAVENRPPEPVAAM